MANNKDKNVVLSFEDFDQWLRSELGQNALKLDTFNETLRQQYGEQIKIGQKMHNIEKDFKELQLVYAEAGFSRLKIEETSTGTKFTFMPYDDSINENDCPFVEINRENNGLVIHNGMVAYNSPVALLNGANQLGFVSETSLALSQVVDEVKQNMSRIRTASSFQRRAKLLKTYTSRAARESSEAMSSLFDKKGLADFKEYNEKAILSKRPESIRAQQSQLHYAHIIQQMYKKASASNLLSYGTDLKKFAAQVEDVINLARSVKDITELEKGLRLNQERNYDMLKIWDTQLKNFLAPIIKNMTQGGITEGISGRIGLLEPDLPFNVFSSTGKKSTQNLQVLSQKTNYAKNLKLPQNKKIKTVAIGMNRIFTESQKKYLEDIGMTSEEMHKDLYGVAYISEKDLEKAWEMAQEMYKSREIDKKTFEKYRRFALKGFGKDASLMSGSLAREMSDIEENRPLKDLDIKEINGRIVDRISKYVRNKNKGKSKEEINKIVDEAVKDFNYFELNEDQKKNESLKYVEKYFKEEMRKLYGLDDLMGKRGGVGGHGFSYNYDKERGLLTNVSTTRKTDPKGYIGRSGATGDYRTSQTSVDDDYFQLILKAAFGDKYDTVKDKVQILRSNDRGFSHKTIETDIKEILNYISIYAKEDWLAKNPFLSQFMTYKNGDIMVNNQFLKDYYGQIKQQSDGGEQFTRSVSQLLVDLYKEASKLDGFDNSLELITDEEALKAIYGDSYKPGKTGPLLVSKGPRVTATENAKSSTFSYNGMGALTGSSHSTTWRERHAIENTYVKFSQFLLDEQNLTPEEYREAIAPLKNLKETVEQKFEKNEIEYDKIVRNSQYIAQTFKANGKKFQKDIEKDETAIVLTLEDIAKTYAEIDYNSTDPSNPGMILKDMANPDNVFAIMAEKMAKERFTKLQNTHQNDWEEFSSRTGIKTYEDLLGRFFVNLGDDKLVGKYNDNMLTTSMIALPQIRYNKKAFDNGVLSLYDGGLGATHIVKALQGISNGEFADKDTARRAAFRVLTNEYDKYYQSITKGSEYERTHEIRDDKSAGRLTTDALSDYSSKVMKNLAQDVIGRNNIKGDEATKVKEQLENVAMVLSTKDYTAMWEERLKENPETARKELDKLFNGLYSPEEIAKRKDLQFKSKDYHKKIKAIVRAFDISDEYYKGRVITDLGWNRDPTINFLRDVSAGTAVLDSGGKNSKNAIVAQGHVLINKDLLAIGHGDMDGDLIAMYHAYTSGDEVGFERALEAFYKDATEQQRKISEEEDKKDTQIRQNLAKYFDTKGANISASQIRYGEQSKVDSVQDQAAKALTVGAMWSAKKGAGLFGDLTFAQENIVQKVKHLNPNSPINGIASLGASTLQAITQSLYQKGINVKNAGELAKSLGEEAKDKYSSGELAAMVQNQANEMFEMINQADTFNDIHQLRRFFEKGSTIGAFDLDAMFEGNTALGVGLQSLNDVGLNNLLELAENHLKNLKNSNEDQIYIDRINKDIAAIKEAQKDPKKNKLKNLTSELAAALVYDLNYGHEYFHGELGDDFVYRYRNGAIPGHGSNQIPKFNKAVVDDIDKFMTELTEKSKNDENAKEFLENSVYGRYARAKQFGLADVNGKSPSAMAKNIMYDAGKHGLEADKMPLVNEIQKEAEELVENIIKTKNPEEIRKKYATAIIADPSIKSTLKGVVTGSITHATAESYEKFGAEYATHNENKGYSREIKKNQNLLTAIFGEKEAEQLVKDAIFRGETNFKAISEEVSKNGGKIIGSEMELAGYGGVTNTGKMKGSKQIADILYKVGNELIVGDYKTYADDKAGLDAILQVKDYMESLKMLQLAMRDTRATSANTFLHSNNVEAENWRRRLGINGNESSIERKEKEARFEKIFNAIARGEDITKIGGRIFVRDTRSGLLRQYRVEDNAGLDKIYQKAKSSNLSVQEYIANGGDEEKALVQKSLKLEKTLFVGNDEEKKRLVSDKIEPLLLAQNKLRAARAKEALNQVREENLRSLAEKGLLTEAEYKEYENLRKDSSDLKEAIGEKGSYEQVQTLTEELQEKQQELDKAVQDNRESDRLQLQEIISEKKALIASLKDTLTYQAEEAEQNLRKQSLTEDEKIGSDLADLYSTADQDESQKVIDQEVKKERQKLAKEELRKKVKGYKDIAQKAAMAEARSKSAVLTDEERERAEEDAKLLIEQRDNTKKYIEEQLDIAFKHTGKKNKKYKFVNIDGKKITQEEAAKLGYYIDFDKVDNGLKDSATRQVDISDRQTIQTTEARMLEYYKDKFRRENEIEELNRKIAQAQQENDEVEAEILTARKGKLTKINELQSDMAKADFKNMRGYTEERDQKIQELGKLLVSKEEDDKKRIQQAQKQAGGAGGGNVGFLGIDAYATRWVSRMMQGGALAAFIRMVRKGLKDITEKAKQLDQAMTNLRIVTGKNAENARTLINQYANLGKQLGATTIEVTNAASAWLRQGYDISQVNDLIKSSMYLSKLGMIDVSEATKDLTSAMHGFKLEASDAMSIVDKLTALDVKAATTAGDIAQGLAQFANIANLNGVNLDQAAAYVATIADVNQASGTTVGQALKTIMSRYGNVKAGAYNKLNVDSESDDTTEKLNDVERILTKMGISIRKTNLEFKDFDEVMDEIAGKWGTMDNVSKKAIANAFAGIRQQESFLILAENYDKYQKLLDVSENSAGTAEKKYQSYKESYAAAKNEFTAALEQVANSSQISKVLTDLLHMGQSIIEALQRIYPLIPAFIKTLTFIRTVFMGKGVLKSGYEAFMGLTGRNVRSKLNDKGSSLGLIGEIKTRRSMNKKIFTLDDINNEKDESKRKKMQKVYDKEQKNKEKEFQKELKYRQQAVAYSRKELEHKKSVLTVSEKEILNKEVVLDKGTMEKLKKEGVVKEGQKTLTYAEAISIVGSGVLQNTKVGKQLEDKILHDRKNGAAAVAYNKIQKEGGIVAPSKAQMGMQKAGAIMNGIEMGIATVATAISQYATAGVTHNYEGKSVESSKEAQKKAGAWASVLSLLPGGSYFAPYVAEWIARNHDAGRDRANSITETANENIGKLNNISSSLESIASSEQGSAERHKLVSEFKKEIFSEDNKELRQLLQHHLGDQSLYTVLNSIDSNTKDSKEALKALQVAQIKAEKAQISGKYASSFFNNKEDLGKIYSRIDNYDGLTAAIVREGLGITAVGNVAGGIAGAGIGAAIGAGIAAGSTTGSAAGPIGTAVGAIVGVIIGTIIGAVGAYNVAEAEKEANRRAYEIWQNYNADQKLNEAQKLLEQEYGAEEQNSQRIQDLTQLINSLKEFKQIETQLVEEANELTLQEALIDSKYGNDSYLSDMTIEELKNIGNDEILLNYAKAIENAGGIQGMNVWADESKTKLSTAGYEYLFTKIRQQGDEEINAVLGGEAFSLEEVLKLRNKYGADSIQVQKYLRAFADSLNLTTDQLDDVVEDFGKLKLSDTYLSTSEISEKVSNFANLMSSVADGAGQASSWMETITNQFPELIYYMGNTSELFSQTIKRTKQFANEYINAQYQDVMNNAELFNTIKDELYDSIGGAAAEALRSNKDITKLSGVMAWVQGQYNTSSGELTEEAQRVMNVIKTMMDNAGMKLTSNIMKQYYDQLIDFRSKQIDKELENLESQKEALKDINNQREYENKLVEARLKLEDAEKQKKRVYRAGIGWTYQSDQQAIETAQKELESLRREKQISELDERITALQGQKTELTEMYDKQNYETLRDLYRAAVKEGDIVENIHSAIAMLKDSVDGIQVPVSKLVDQQLDTAKENKTAAVKEAKLAWNDFIKLNPGSGAYNTALQNFHNKMEVAYANNATEEDFAGLDKYQKYNDNRSNIKNEATAWEVFKGGSYDTQKTYVTSQFAIKDLGDGGTWISTSTGELLTDPDKLRILESGLRAGTAGIMLNGEKIVFGVNESKYLMTDSDENLTGYFQRLSSLGVKNAYIQSATPSGKIDAFYNQGNIYRVVGSDGNPYATLVKDDAGIAPAYNKEVVKNAWGSLGLSKNSMSWINELGTEAIITPQGTLTALPSRTGIVPADITKNLWELGEVAPSLVNILNGKLSPDRIGNSIFDSIANDESFNVDNLVMNVTADSSFDVDKFVSMIKSRVALTKNSR